MYNKTTTRCRDFPKEHSELHNGQDPKDQKSGSRAECGVGVLGWGQRPLPTRRAWGAL